MNERACRNCQNTTFYELSNGQLKCKKCRKRMSETNNTSLDNLKLCPEKLLRLIELVCENPTLSIHGISKTIGVSFVTAQKRKQLISAVILETNSRNPKTILNRLMENKNDSNRIKPVVAKMKGLSDEEVIKIREMSKSGIKTSKICRMFGGLDNSNTRKIIKGKLYKYLPV